MPTGVRGHGRHIIIAWNWLKGGHPCHGARCRRWISGVSLFGLRCRRGEPAGAVPTVRDSSGHRVQVAWPRGWPESLRTVRGVRIRARSRPAGRSRRGCWRCATPIRPGARARSCAAWSGRALPAGISTVHEILRRHGRIIAAAGRRWGAAALREAGAEPALADGLQGLDRARRRQPLPSADHRGRSFALSVCACRPAPIEQRSTVQHVWSRPSAAMACPRPSSSTTARPGATHPAGAGPGSRRLAAQARRRRAPQPALSSAEPRQERTLPSHLRPRCSRSRRFRDLAEVQRAFDRWRDSLQSRPAARGARSAACRPAATGQASRHARPPASHRIRRATRSCAPSPPPRPMSASKGGLESPAGLLRRAPRHPPAHRLTDNTASSSPPTKSQPST